MNKKLLLIGIAIILLLITMQGVIAAGTAPTSTDTVAYWKLEDLTDETANSYDLINNGSAASGGTGIINNGYTFTAAGTTFMSSNEVNVDIGATPVEFCTSYWI